MLVGGGVRFADPGLNPLMDLMPDVIEAYRSRRAALEKRPRSVNPRRDFAEMESLVAELTAAAASRSDH